MTRPARGLTPLDPFTLGTVRLWSACVVVATLLAGRPLGDVVGYLLPGLMAVVGVALGRRASTLPPAWTVWGLVAVGAWFTLSALLTAQPGKLPTTYPNANAAVGVQLVALVALAALGFPRPRSARDRWALAGAAAAAMGVLLVNDSVAGWAVALR